MDFILGPGATAEQGDYGKLLKNQVSACFSMISRLLIWTMGRGGQGGMAHGPGWAGGHGPWAGVGTAHGHDLDP